MRGVEAESAGRLHGIAHRRQGTHEFSVRFSKYADKLLHRSLDDVLDELHSFVPRFDHVAGPSPRDEDVTFEYLTTDGIVADGVVKYTGPSNDLVVRVDPESGQADLRHRSQFIDPFDITFYSVLSESGSLSVAGWNSFSDSGAASA